MTRRIRTFGRARGVSRELRRRQRTLARPWGEGWAAALAYQPGLQGRPDRHVAERLTAAGIELLTSEVGVGQADARGARALAARRPRGTLLDPSERTIMHGRRSMTTRGVRSDA